MELDKRICTNCLNKNNVNCTNNRLVTESCGHVKCMKCLLEEESGCRVCNVEKNDKNIDDCNTDKELNEEANKDNAIDHDVVVDEETSDNIEPVEDIGQDIEVQDKPKHTHDKTEENEVKKGVVKNDIDWAGKKSYKPDAPHIKVHKDSGIRYYYCSVCKAQFRTLNNVRYHLFCNGNKKPYQCTQCNKGFAMMTFYQYHMRKHRGERPFACDTCGATFSFMSKLVRHELCHKEEREYKCKQCNKGFTTRTALRKHSLLHSGEQPFKCGNCSRRFRDSSNYKKHLLRCHDETKCLCGMCAASRGRARAHQCPRCSHSFNSGKDLTRHLQIHTEALPYRCKVCDRRFRRKDNLERHIKNKHPNHTSATAAECDLTALQARRKVTKPASLETKTDTPEDVAEKTQLEKLNPLPPMPNEVIQLISKDKKTPIQTTIDKEVEPVIDKSYIIEANIARQSVIVAKNTAVKRTASPETYVHKIKKSMTVNQKDIMLPPIDTKKLCQFYKEATQTDNLDIGDPRPESVQKFKTILMMDGKNMNNGEKNKKEEDKQTPMQHWRRKMTKMTLDTNW